MTPEQLAELDAAVAAARPPASGVAAPDGAPHPLRALYGYGERPQEIYTPARVRDALLRLWPEGIELDACGGPGSILGARREYYVPPTVLPPAKPGGKPRVIYDPSDGTDGLTRPWAPRTYANPPFNDLQRWLKAWELAPMEACILAPVRTHRKWFRAAMRAACSQGRIVWLDPLAFEGHKQSFPAPLCVLYRGVHTLEHVRKAFGEIGEVL